MKNLFLLPILLLFITLQACDKSDVNELSVDVTSIAIPEAGGNATIVITTDAGMWQIDNSGSDWIKLSATSGELKTAMITVLVNTLSATLRTDTLTISAGNAKPVYVIVSQAASEFLYTLSSGTGSITFKKSGNEAAFRLSTTAPEWSVSASVDWLAFDKTTGTESETYITVSASPNEGIEKREAIITLSAEYAPQVEISVTQNGELYPNYNTSPQEPDNTGMTSTATELAAKIVLGWNLGNSLEAPGGETTWGNPATTQALIDLVKQSGFNAIRIPAAWNSHLSNATTAEINPVWLARVKDVVQYCVNNDLYVILNIHWDGGWLENNCTLAKQEENNAKQKAFWEQIASYLRDFDEHLLFAGANEPNVENATEMSVLNSYSQTFIDAVRSTGGKNAYRTLIIQGPSTDIEKTNQLMMMPTDKIPNRMMVEIHYYTPWNFCGMTEDATWGKMFYYWGEGFHSESDPDRNATYGEESTVLTNFGLMKSKFVDKGIPVVLGEYSALRRSELSGDALSNHLASRAYFFKYVTQQAKAHGLLPFYWDNGDMGNNGCALFNRSGLSVFDQQALDALVEGAQ
ncbi:MAG: cellulase family glycosylhydrolase [Salinivirgaceae bacterium]